MPVIYLHKIPLDVRQMVLKSLEEKIKQVVVEVKELNFTEDDVTIRAPVDRLDTDKSSKIVIKIEDLLTKPGRTKEVTDMLAQKIGMIVREQFPAVPLVECIVQTLPATTSVWTSKAEQDAGAAPAA